MDEKHLLHRIVVPLYVGANGDVLYGAFVPTERDKQLNSSYHLSVIAGSVRPAKKACREHATKFKKDVAGCAALYHSDVERIAIEKAKLRVINDGGEASAHRSIVIPPPASMSNKAHHTSNASIRAHHTNIAKRLLEQAKKNGDEQGLYYVYLAA